MSEMKVYDGAAWDGTFTPKTYNGTTWDSLAGTVKVYTGGQWVIFWPPGADGATAPVVLITWSGASALAFSASGTATLDAFFEITGAFATVSNGGTRLSLQNWISSAPSGVGADYEMKATQASGDPITSNITLGSASWASMGTERWFSISDTVDFGAAKSATINVTIREVGNVASETTDTLIISADYNSA